MLNFSLSISMEKMVITYINTLALVLKGPKNLESIRSSREKHMDLIFSRSRLLGTYLVQPGGPSRPGGPAGPGGPLNASPEPSRSPKPRPGGPWGPTGPGRPTSSSPCKKVAFKNFQIFFVAVRSVLV